MQEDRFRHAVNGDDHFCVAFHRHRSEIGAVGAQSGGNDGGHIRASFALRRRSPTYGGIMGDIRQFGGLPVLLEQQA
jgi:hypothetical protein